MSEALSLKDQGNKEFKEGNWLKAAALYSKGLKEDPQNAILLSNRSAALLKLNKVQKALADAQECIRVRSDWDKGYFRKGSILEATKNYEQALDVYQEALKCNPESKEVASKIKFLTRQIRSPATINGSHKPAAGNGAIDSKQAYDEAKASLVKSKPSSSTPEHVEDFWQRMLGLVESEIQNRTFDRTFPAVFFLPGSTSENGKEQAGQVSIQAAFDSPDTLASALSFLRQYSEDTAAQAAVAIVPKHKIAFPQVWQKAGWPHGRMDGLFVQLQTQKGSQSKLVFVPLGQKHREPLPLKDKFAILESILR